MCCGADGPAMKKSLLHLFLFGVSGAGFFALVLAVYASDKALAGRLAVDLAMINLGGAVCRFGLDLAVIQRSDKTLRFGLGDALFVVPLAAMLYSLVVLGGAQNVGIISLTVLVTMVAFNEILAAHLRNSGLQTSIYLVRISGFLPGLALILLADNLDGDVIEIALLLVNVGIVIGLVVIGYVRIARDQSGEGERITIRWLTERFTLVANLNSLTATLLAKADVLVFATMLSDAVIGDYSIIKQTLGVLMFVSASFNYRYASDVRRIWQSQSRAMFRRKFGEHAREAALLTAVGLVLAAAALTIECQVLDLAPNTPLFAALLVAYGAFAVASTSGMYLTAMGRIGFQTIRLVGSLILFLLLAFSVNAVWPESALVLATYSASIATFQLLLFANLTRLLTKL